MLLRVKTRHSKQSDQPDDRKIPAANKRAWFSEQVILPVRQLMTQLIRTYRFVWRPGWPEINCWRLSAINLGEAIHTCPLLPLLNPLLLRGSCATLSLPQESTLNYVCFRMVSALLKIKVCFQFWAKRFVKMHLLYLFKKLVFLKFNNFSFV